MFLSLCTLLSILGGWVVRRIFSKHYWNVLSQYPGLASQTANVRSNWRYLSIIQKLLHVFDLWKNRPEVHKEFFPFDKMMMPNCKKFLDFLTQFVDSNLVTDLTTSHQAQSNQEFYHGPLETGEGRAPLLASFIAAVTSASRRPLTGPGQLARSQFKI